MKKLCLSVICCLMSVVSMQAQQAEVYFTKEITPESLVKIYEALGVKAHGQVAVKISTGESGGNNYLKPPLIRNLVEKVDGTIVECCTAYGGSRQDKAKHWETIHEHGFDSIFKVDIMDEFGNMQIPVKDTTWIKYDVVGDHLSKSSAELRRDGRPDAFQGTRDGRFRRCAEKPKHRFCFHSRKGLHPLAWCD